jgi:hypothetical protein
MNGGILNRAIEAVWALRLAKAYRDARLEAACTRALLLGTYRYQSIESILKHGWDSKPVEVAEESTLPPQHENVRGVGLPLNTQSTHNQ